MTAITLLPWPRSAHASPSLRWYQEQAYEQAEKALAQGLRPIICLPTGSGKTVVAAKIVNDWVGRDRQVLFLAHRVELINQAYRRIGSLDGFKASTIQGFNHNFDPDLIIIDECHHTPANTYKTLIEAYPAALVMGLSATPERADGESLMPFFDVIVCPTNAHDLTEQGFLAPATVYVPEDQILGASLKVGKFGDYTAKSIQAKIKSDQHILHAIDQYRRHAIGRRGIIFCANVEHSKRVAAAYCQAGFKATALDGGTTKADRLAAFDGWANGSIDIICNCELFVEGLDLPNVDFIQCLRPTQSTTLWFQMLGRGMRPGDRDVVILDHTDNTQRLRLPEGVDGYDLVDCGEKGIRWRSGVKRLVVGEDGALVESEKAFVPPVDLVKINRFHLAASSNVSWGLALAMAKAKLEVGALIFSSILPSPSDELISDQYCLSLLEASEIREQAAIVSALGFKRWNLLDQYFRAGAKIVNLVESNPFGVNNIIAQKTKIPVTSVASFRNHFEIASRHFCAERFVSTLSIRNCIRANPQLSAGAIGDLLGCSSLEIKRIMKFPEKLHLIAFLESWGKGTGLRWNESCNSRTALTQAETNKKKEICDLISKNPLLSDIQISDICGVGPITVSLLRKPA